MVNFKNTKLWKAAFESEQAQTHSPLIEKLIHVFDKTRENTKVLVTEIARDLPEYTVHDIEHIDALWEVGSEIVGDNFKINPVEGFVLGCSFLFHDAAMTKTAYPGGVENLKQTTEWKRISQRLASSHERIISDKEIIEIFLREQHAVQAESLPKTVWGEKSSAHFLIEDSDFRNWFGDFIGSVAASHWWNHEEIESRLNHRIIAAPAPYPSGWSIDLLKLACVLRTADAAQIDQRRAPSFLLALRKNELNSYSELHWRFQNYLTQTRISYDALVFASLRPFQKSDAPAWWLLHDTLKMVDRELRQTDDLLFRLRGQNARFAARKVANLEAPQNLKTNIPTEGWNPIDTSFSINDIPKLVANLGGQQLYGKNRSAAIREVVQNAMDAIRLRQIIDPSSPNPLVEIKISEQNGQKFITVSDNGVGMSAKSIVKSLLAFGTSGWAADEAIGEYQDTIPKEDSFSGKYGIGFFSIFMLADQVIVKSRRFDGRPEDTVILEFNEGLSSRPILSNAQTTDRMTTGGTEVIVRLKDVIQENDFQFDRDYETIKCRLSGSLHEIADEVYEFLSRTFPVSEIPTKVISEEFAKIIDGRNWIDEPAKTLLLRVEGQDYVGNGEGDSFTAKDNALSLIRDTDGNVLGRASIDWLRPRARNGRRNDVLGVLVSKGAVINRGRFRGVMLARPTKASRDHGEVLASLESVRDWASEQARLAIRLGYSDEVQEKIAQIVASLEGELGELKICEVGGKYLNIEELKFKIRLKDLVWIAQDASISLAKPTLVSAKRSDETISVAMGVAVFSNSSQFRIRKEEDFSKRMLSRIVEKIICEEFSIDNEVYQKLNNVIDEKYQYSGIAPSWVGSNLELRKVIGHKYVRNMKLEDICGPDYAVNEEDGHS